MAHDPWTPRDPTYFSSLRILEKEGGSTTESCVTESSGLCAESVGVGCQRAPIARRIRYPQSPSLDYGVTKKWVIVTEISKEDENNNITRLNAYSKYYVPRRPRVGEVGRSAGPGDGGVGGSHSGGGSSGRS